MKDPVLFDNERMKQLSALAIELAITAPEIRRVGSDYGFVPWSLIERAREACTNIGLDWQTLRKQAMTSATMDAMIADEIMDKEPS